MFSEKYAEKEQEGEKNHLDSLQPIAIHFLLKHLQESSRQSGYFVLL